MTPHAQRMESVPHAVAPGRKWRWARRTTQALALFALVVGPVVGGWQRLEYTHDMATWADVGWSLPPTLQDALPHAFSSDALYEANQLMGGGIAAELFTVPMMDPLAGALTLLAGSADSRTLVAVGLPLLLALVAGRVFCGWFCTFGILSRALDAVCARFGHDRFHALPKRRWLRYVLLVGAIAASLLGSHLLLYLLLPYLLLQQSIYSAWLLGGGSAILGVLGGLLFAGVLFGPTVYCAALCPTGTALGLLGSGRILRLRQPDPSACGAHCDLCNRACWLQLDPRSGDPGSDCDLCSRCVSACPRMNLVLAAERPRSSSRDRRAALWAIVSLASVLGAPGEASASNKPALIMDAELTRGDVTIAVSAVDYSEFNTAHDWAETEPVVEISIFLARGELQRPDSQGLIAGRTTYVGPLRLDVLRQSADAPQTFDFDEANSPISAQRRSIYRARSPLPLVPGDRVRIQPIPGWLDESLEVTLPRRGARVAIGRWAGYFALSALGFSALLSLSFVRLRTRETRGVLGAADL